jgi:HK97 family phage portal protein
VSRAVKNILARAETFGRPSRVGGPGAAVKAVVAADAERIGVQGRPRYPDIGGDSLGRAHRRNELVYACVRVKGNALAKPRLIVETRTASDTYEEVVGHPLRRLLIRPNDRMDTADFFRAVVVSRDIYGKVFCEKLLSPAGAVVGLNPLDPRKMRFVTGTDDQGRTVVAGWEWRDGSARVRFAPEELLIWEPLDWVEPPAAEVALGSVDSDSAQTDYVRAFFNNAGVPSGILSLKRQNVQQPEVDRIKERWRASYGRAGGGQHDIAVLDEGAEYQKIGSGLDELESETVRGVSESRICMAFGVPPLIVYAYVGLLRATYANLKEAYSGFWDLTIDPLLGSIASWLTMTLLEEFEGKERVLGELVRLRWDTKDVAALQDDEDAKQTRARENFRAGVTTLNEARNEVGADADPAGDYYLRSVALAAVPYGAVEEVVEGDGGEGDQGDEDGGDDPAAVEQAPEGDGLDNLPKARKLRALATRALKAASVGPIERRLERELRAYLAEEYGRAADAARGEG